MRLRPELRVDRTPDGVVVTDPALGRRVDLGAIGDVIDRLDGRDVADVATDARSDAVVRTLLLLRLVEGAGDADRARLARLRAGEPLPVVGLPRARFACQGSGGCCSNYVFGPLTDADVARVSALDLSELGVEGPFYETIGTPSGPARFLRTTPDGTCVFLRDGARCGLHARFGGASKPGFCQLFPLVAWATVGGVRLYDGGECVSFPTSASTGAAVLEQWAEVRARLPVSQPAHPLVHLAPGAPCDLGVWLPVMDAAAALVRPEPPSRTLRAFGRLYTDAIAALRRCPLTTTGAEDALAPLLAAEPVRWYAHTDPPADAVAVGRDAIAGLARAVATIAGEPIARGAPAPPLTRELVAAATRLADAASGGAPLPPEDPSTRELWALALRQRAFGQRGLVDGRPRAALLRACLDWLLARANPGGERRGHTLVARRLDLPWAPVHRLLVTNEGVLGPVLAALEAI